MYKYCTLEKWFNMKQMDIFMMMRHPVDRAISHFYFHKQLKHGSNDTEFVNMTLTEYLNNSPKMMKHRSIWFDGQAGIAWLAGTHTSKWVQKGIIDKRKMELIQKNLCKSKNFIHLVA